MRCKQWMLLSALLVGLTTQLEAQTVISATRSIDWTQAGIPGGIPNRKTICATLSPGATYAQINSAIAACNNGVVFLNPGTYTLAGGIVFNNKSNVTLRGAGPDRTFLKFTAGNSCGGLGGDLCIINSDPHCGGCGSPSNVANWTAAYAPGTAVITLSALTKGSTPPAVGQMIFLDQNDDGGSDTGQIWVCQTANVCSSNPGSGNGRPGRGQQQAVRVTSVTGSGPYTVGISPATRMPNVRASQSPQAWWSNGMPVSRDGVEDLSMDHTNTGSSIAAGIFVFNGYNVWFKNIRDINSQHKHIWFYQSAASVVRESYFYGSWNAASESYGVDTYNGADNLIENNIFQHIATGMITEGCVGCVFSYNYAIDDYYTANGAAPGWQQFALYGHSVGDAYVLWEGNQAVGLVGDDIHGTRHFVTAFRNYLSGRDAASPTPKTQQTSVIILEAYNRYFNFVGNVLGTPGYHTNYQVAPSSATDGGSAALANRSIYSFGYSGNEGTHGAFNNDMTLLPTTMRWGNYDTVNNAVRFVASEVPTGLSLYANPVPVSQVLPASLRLALQPGFWRTPWGTPPWPAIGPDVTGGNVPGLGGHANNIPAQMCYANSPIDANYPGAADRGMLLFNAASCYPNAAGPAAPTNLRITQ